MFLSDCTDGVVKCGAIPPLITGLEFYREWTMEKTLNSLKTVFGLEEEEICERVVMPTKSSSYPLDSNASVFSFLVWFLRKSRAEHMDLIYSVLINIMIDGSVLLKESDNMFHPPHDIYRNQKPVSIQRHKVYFDVCNGVERFFSLFQNRVFGKPCVMEKKTVKNIYPLLYDDRYDEHKKDKTKEVLIDTSNPGVDFPIPSDSKSYTSPSARFFGCRLIARLFCNENIPKRYMCIFPYIIRVTKLREPEFFDPGETQKSINSYIEKYVFYDYICLIYFC